jgi:DNA-binding MarR family transcriptional regulator
MTDRPAGQTEPDSRARAAGGSAGGREELAVAIYGELALIVRRLRAPAAEAHSGLSLTANTLPTRVAEVGTARAADLIARCQLKKSTVSRQLSELLAGGPVDRDPADSRVQVVQVKAPGRALLTRVSERSRERTRTRLADWPEDDLAAFGRLIARYNGGPSPAPTG